jgi:hypothetical protein
VCHDDFPNILSAFSVSSSTVPSPVNTKLSHRSPSLHAHDEELTPSTAYTEYSIHQLQRTPSTASTEYCILRVLRHPIINCLLLPVSLLSRCRPCCTELSTFPQCQVNQWLESQLLWHRPPDLPAPNRPPRSNLPLLHNHVLRVHHQTRTITAARCIFTLTQSQPPTVSPNLHDYGLQTRSIIAWSVYFVWLDDVYLPRCLPNIYCLLLNLSPLSLYPRMYI